MNFHSAAILSGSLHRDDDGASSHTHHRIAAAIVDLIRGSLQRGAIGFHGAIVGAPLQIIILLVGVPTLLVVG